MDSFPITGLTFLKKLTCTFANSEQLDVYWLPPIVLELNEVLLSTVIGVPKFCLLEVEHCTSVPLSVYI